MNSARKKPLLLVWVYLIFIIIIPFLVSCTMDGIDNHQSKSSNNNHDPIVVDGNQGFDPVIWSGLGTKISPYYIDGITINQTNIITSKSELIIMRNTDCYFYINNSQLIGGDTGIYLENVTNGLITNTIVYQNGGGGGIIITESENITIFNNTVNQNYFYGIDVGYSENITIYDNNVIQNVGDGISFPHSANNTVYDNYIFNNSNAGIQFSWSNNNIVNNNSVLSNNGDGIYLSRSFNNSIFNNSISTNNRRGVFLSRSLNNSVCDNTFQDNGFFVSANQVTECFQANVSGNKVNSKSLIFWENIANANISNEPLDSNQIVLINCTFVNITKQVATNDYIGILGLFCTEIKIYNNNISQARNGFEFYSSTNVSIHNNTLNQCQKNGVFFYSTVNSSIFDNMVYSCLQNAIELEQDCNNNSLDNNIILNNTGDGIFQDTSERNVIFNNSVKNNGNDGISLKNSFDNSIINNTVFNNIGNGIALYSSTNTSMINNSLYNNSFYVDGYQLEDCTQKTVENNSVDGKTLIFWQNISLTQVPTNTGQIILINCSDIVINDLEFETCTFGLRASFCSNLLIKNNSIPIFLYEASNNTIYDNRVSDNTANGIYFSHSFNNTIKNNTIHDNENYGVYLYDSSNNNIENNNIHNNGIGGLFLDYSTNNTIFNNSIYSDGNFQHLDRYPGIYLTDSIKNTIYNNTLYNYISGILFINSESNLIEKNRILDSREAIEFFESGNNTIFNNEFEMCGIRISGFSVDKFLQYKVEKNYINNKPLIFLQNIDSTTVPTDIGQIVLINCTNINIQKHKLDACTVGVLLAFCSNTTVNNNTFCRNVIGIELHLSNDITLSNNIVENGSCYGIQLLYSSKNLVINNTIKFVSENGIRLINSINNTISLNIILSNTEHGIRLLSTCKNNTVCFNDFIANDNFDNSSQAIDDGSNNTFSHNHWSDWRSPDLDLDGIVDIPYSIMGLSNNKDPYPLTDPNIYIYPVDNPSSDPYESIDPDDLISLQNFVNFILVISFCALFVFGSFIFLSKYNKKRLTTDTSPHVLTKTGKSNTGDFSVNFGVNTTSVSNKEITSRERKEKWRRREFPDSLPLLILIITAIVGFILQIVRPPQIRNLSYDQVVDHPIRREILEVLRETQIQHYSGLKRLLNCGTSVLLWHLQVLEDFNLIRCHSLCKIKAYYLVNSGISPSKVSLFCSIQSQRGLLISRVFLTPPIKGWSIKDLSNQNNLSRKAVRYYCKKLKSLGVIDHLKDTREFKLVTSQQQNLSWLLQLYGFKS